MNKNLLGLGMIGILVFGIGVKVWAQEAEEIFFMEIPSVIVASRMEEKVTEATGIVKVWTAEEIRKMGIYTLDELAQITVGYGIEEADGLHGFEVRGFHGNAFDNQKVLLMINGMPINSARNGRAWTGEELPLYFAKRVEFLKGPSSALYGNGAVLGVINIVTQEPQEGRDLFETKISAGSPDERKRFMGHCLMRKKNISGDTCFGFYGKNNSEKIFSEDSKVLDSKKNCSLFSTFDCTNDSPLNGLKFGVFSISQRGGLGTGWIGTTHKIDDYTFETLQPFLAYNKNLTNGLSLNTKLLFQRNDDIGLFFAGGSDVMKFGLIANLYMGDVSLVYDRDKFNIIGGVAYDRRWHTSENSHFYTFGSGTITTGGDYYFNKSKSVIMKSAYLQLQKEFPVLEGLKSTMGIRLDDCTNLVEERNSFSKTSPRIGFVQRVTDCLNVKLLYSTAMRGPGLKESIDNTMYAAQYADWKTNHATTTTYADEHCLKDGKITFTAKPETIDTLEASADYHAKRFQTSITYFNSTMENPIRAFNIVEGFVVPYLNVAKEQKASGVEFDFNINIPNGKFFANAAIQKGETSDDGKEISNIPQTKLNAGVLYHLPADTDVSLLIKNARYTKRGTTDAAILSKLGDRVDDHTLVDINCIKKIDDNVQLELKINNLFNEDWYYPQLSNTLSFDHPQPGRTALLSMDVKF
ncbi:TonB-dependent receptor [bacterium]|nr:TonB-dependent receptor [bacterium]MBU1754350.1 TonB-dependent receptor [bacterium]